jgi:benzoyl-CoA reductase subunit A
MKCVVGIDLGSTTTKAVLIDDRGKVVGRGITNSRSDYGVAAAVAREEALRAARFALLEQALEELGASRRNADLLKEAFRLETYLDQLAELRREILGLVASPWTAEWRKTLEPAVAEVLDRAEARAPELFSASGERRSDFFRDLAGAAYVSGAEIVAERDGVPFERVLSLYDRAILNVETQLLPHTFEDLLRRAVARVRATGRTGDMAAGDVLQSSPQGALQSSPPTPQGALQRAVDQVIAEPIEEMSFVGTGYGRQTLPFPKAAVRSEILCHGRGAHWFFPGTRTVLDIGGQDTKAIQLDETGVVTSFQMNDRCAAGCGRYLGYIADELNLGLHELGPLALQAKKTVRVNSTCTVFAGAELRERLALGQSREDILAGLHRAIMLRSLSLLARSGGIANELSFTGGVCRNPMATKILGELVRENYGGDITINAHPDSIYMGALGAALFARDDVEAGKALPLLGAAPAFAAAAA